MVGMTEFDVCKLRDYAADLAQQAASLISTKRSEITATGDIRAHSQTKTSAVDPVTEVDTAAEEFVVGSIRKDRPDDGIIGEEGANVPSQSGVSWIIDPIDGTVNFMYGLGEYAVSLGAMVDGQYVAGAVINVVKGTLYSAAVGHGATVTYRDGTSTQLRCRQETDPRLSLIATGFGYTETRRAGQAKILQELLPQVRDIRRMGSAALDLCRVAEGTVDAYYEHGVKVWDVSAGIVIARESGAQVHVPHSWTSDDRGALVWAASAELAPAFERLLASAGANEVID